MTLFGTDFRRARHTWLYDRSAGQGVWTALLLGVAVLLAYFLLQTVAGFAVFLMLGGSLDPKGAATIDINLFGKASVLGLLPSALAAGLLAYWVAGVRNANGRKGVPLHLPQLGAGGWVVTIGGFLVILNLLFAAIFWVTGIDPQDYRPGGGGLSEGGSAGLVEKVVADLADEPHLFLIAIPAITVFVPFVEELIFRGALFSALVRSPLGAGGAVLITAALFAVIHGMGAPLLFIGFLFIMGIALGLLLLRFGSLALTIICHGIWNALMSLALFGGQASP